MTRRLVQQSCIALYYLSADEIKVFGIEAKIENNDDIML